MDRKIENSPLFKINAIVSNQNIPGNPIAAAFVNHTKITKFMAFQLFLLETGTK